MGYMPLDHFAALGTASGNNCKSGKCQAQQTRQCASLRDVHFRIGLQLVEQCSSSASCDVS